MTAKGESLLQLGVVLVATFVSFGVDNDCHYHVEVAY